MTARFVIGDTRKVLDTLEPGSVDLVLCSPPFLALRSYLPADHVDKALEIGSEATPGAFIDVLLDVVEACARVLAPHGTLAFELGDTYGGHDNRGSGDDDARHDAKTRFVQTGAGWPLDKSLCLIPESFRWALVYGRNPFTGRETPRWRARNVIRWCRPNPPVGALGDKFRPATSEMVVVCKSRTRWFDLDAVRTAVAHPLATASSTTKAPTGQRFDHYNPSESAGAPPLDWWEIPTQPYAGAHFATFPEKLVTKPIAAMCPREVCRTCGEPRRRIVDHERSLHAAQGAADGARQGAAHGKSLNNFATAQGGKGYTVTREHVGWTDCAHDDYRRGVVLDPFCGSGTTLAVAEGLGRDSIGIDLDARNADLAHARVGMFLTVEASA